MILIAQISIVLGGTALFFGFTQWLGQRGTIEREQYMLDCAIYQMEQNLIEQEERLALEAKEEKEQSEKVFMLDFKITHGSAFGGFCATMNDGRKKKGTVPLENILLYGKHPTGKEFTYYIEDQKIEICARDEEDELLIRSTGPSFEIRQSGQGRDEGTVTKSAIIKKDILYYIILESKHEITLKARRGC